MSPQCLPVSSRSWRCRGDVSPIADKFSLCDVAATDGDVAEMSPRPAGDWKKSPKIEQPAGQSSGPNAVPPKLLKLIACEIAPALSFLFQQSYKLDIYMVGFILPGH